LATAFGHKLTVVLGIVFIQPAVSVALHVHELSVSK
jgi:hypothetical protein